MHIIGTGPTRKNYKPDGNDTIGVNDILDYIACDKVIIVDPANRFSEGRRQAIMRSEGQYLIGYTGGSKESSMQYNTWKDLLPYAEYFPIYRWMGVLQPGKVFHSVSSPFVAASYGINRGYADIVFHGCDYLNHPRMGGPLMRQAVKDIEGLKKSWKDGKMYVSNGYSKLSTVLPIWKG